MAGIVLTLTTAGGLPVDSEPTTPGVQPYTTTTDANGIYTFTNLAPGTYQIEMTAPDGYMSTAPDSVNPLAGDNVDDGVSSGDGAITTKPFVLEAGVNLPGVQTVDDATGTTTNPSIDFGLVQEPDWGDLPADYNSTVNGNTQFPVVPDRDLAAPARVHNQRRVDIHRGRVVPAFPGQVDLDEHVRNRPVAGQARQPDGAARRCC